MDAVLAIAITLPVVELHAPKPEAGDLAAAYLKLAPEYGAYVLSVILIGLYWAHSHFSGKLLEKTDHGYNLLSIGFLAAVSITPFLRGRWSNTSAEMRRAPPPPYGIWA